MMATHDAARKEVEDVTTEKLENGEDNPNFIPDDRRRYVSSETPPLGVKIYPGLEGDKSATWFDKKQADSLRQQERDRLSATSAKVAKETGTTARHDAYFSAPTIRQTSGLPASLPPTTFQNSLIQKSFLMKEIDEEQEEAYFSEKDSHAISMVKNGVAASNKVAMDMLSHIADGGIDDHDERMDNLAEAHDKIIQYHEKMGGHPFQEDDDQLAAHVDNLLNDKTNPVEGHDPRNLIPQNVKPPVPTDAGSKRVGGRAESTPTPPPSSTKEEDQPVGAKRIVPEGTPLFTRFAPDQPHLTAAQENLKEEGKLEKDPIKRFKQVKEHAKTPDQIKRFEQSPEGKSWAAGAGERRTKEAEAIYEKFSDHFKAVHASDHGDGGVSEEEFKNHIISNAAGSDKSLATFKFATSKANNSRLKRDNSAKKRAESAEKTAKANEKKAEAKLDASVLHTDLNRTDEERNPSLPNRKATSKAEAQRLLNDHDGDREAAQKSVTDRWAREDAANTLPEHLDSKEKINEAMFGVEDPTGKLAGRHPTRNENRDGRKATSMTRDLLAHFDEHGDDMSPETRKVLVERLSQLVDPARANKGFSANRGERFADIQHAKNQLDELKKQGISPSSDEGKALLEKMDEQLSTRTKNFEANHVNTDADHENNERIWDHGNSNHTHQFDEEGNSTGRTRHNPDTGEREAHDGEDVRHSRVKEHHDNLSDEQSNNLQAVHEAHQEFEDVRGGHPTEAHQALADHHEASQALSNATQAIERHEASQKKGLQGKHGEEHASKTRIAETKKLESADVVKGAEAAHEKSLSEREKIQGDIDATYKSEVSKRTGELRGKIADLHPQLKAMEEARQKRTQERAAAERAMTPQDRSAAARQSQLDIARGKEPKIEREKRSEARKRKKEKDLRSQISGIQDQLKNVDSEARVSAQQQHQDAYNENQKSLSDNKKALNSAKADDQTAQSSVDELNGQLEEAKKFRETEEGGYGSKDIEQWKGEREEAQGRQQQAESSLSEAGVSSEDIASHHEAKDKANDAIDSFSEGLDEGQSADDYVHSEEDHNELTTGPPDPEVAKQMTAQGYEWHEDTRRWRHKETHDDHVKANGIGNGTITAGNHSASGGAHGYMATASMGADGQVTATPDSGNFAITPAGTHAVSSNLGGPPPTSPKGIQSHKLGQALNNAGITHNGTSSTFNLKHIKDTGIHESKNYKPPTGAAASKAGGRTKISRFATEAGYNKKGAFHQIITNAPKLVKPLINRALGRDVEKAIDIDNLTSVELLKLHVALQKEKEHTLV
jgi:hypothetical protein